MSEAASWAENSGFRLARTIGSHAARARSRLVASERTATTMLRSTRSGNDTVADATGATGEELIG